jgi:hypothetical protein
MTTILNNTFTINGVVSTDKTVLQNITEIATACGAWVTYDISTGQWSVIINDAQSSVATFNDSNIIGNINVSGTGVNELYNQGTIEFPHRDLRDERDYVDLEIPLADRFPNEIDNRLNMATDLINDPIQAEYLLKLELQQNRLDKVIQFRTDYTSLGLKAGDVISVTSEMYGYTNKTFRITSIEENDDEILSLNITALEYDASIYTKTGFIRQPRLKATGIAPKQANTVIVNSDSQATAVQNAVGSSQVLTPEAIALAFASGQGPFYEFFKTSADVTSAGIAANNPGTDLASYFSTNAAVADNTVLDIFNEFSGNVEATPGVQGSGFSGDLTAFASVEFSVPTNLNSFQVIVECPYADYFIFPILPEFFVAEPPVGSSGQFVALTNFQTLSQGGVTYMVNPQFTTIPSIQVGTDLSYVGRGISGYIPMVCQLYYEGQLVASKFTDWQSSSIVFLFASAPSGNYQLVFQPQFTYNIGSNAADFRVFHGGYTATGSTSAAIAVSAQGFKIQGE